MNPTTTKYKMKKLYILLAVLSGLACVGLALSRLLVNYATVSTVSQAAGPEHAPTYTALAVVCLVLTVAALACREKAKMQSTKSLVCFLIAAAALCGVTGAVAGSIPATTNYMAAKADPAAPELYPIDQLGFDRTPEEKVFFFKEVRLGKSYWCGGSDRFTFAPKENQEQSTWDHGDDQAVLTYYYLQDPTGRRLQENSFKTAFSVTDVEQEELENGPYRVCNYDTYSRVTYADDTSTFCLTAPHTVTTRYTDAQLLSVGKTLHQALQTRAKIQK